MFRKILVLILFLIVPLMTFWLVDLSDLYSEREALRFQVIWLLVSAIFSLSLIFAINTVARITGLFYLMMLVAHRQYQIWLESEFSVSKISLSTFDFFGCLAVSYLLYIFLFEPILDVNESRLKKSKH